MSTNKGMWMMLVILAVVLEGTALFYQYVLGDYPCVVCIHVRLWVAAIGLIALLGLVLPISRWAQVPVWLLMVGASAGFVERAYHTLAVEKGWRMSTCGFDLGLPEWFAIDHWIPWVFEVQGSCGTTPEMVAGFTMAEVLIVVAALTALYALVGLVRMILSKSIHYTG